MSLSPLDIIELQNALDNFAEILGNYRDSLKRRGFPDWQIAMLLVQYQTNMLTPGEPIE